MTAFAEALVAFQSELPAVKKSNTAKVPTKTGGEYKYQYADLTDITEAAMPLLSKHGLSFTSRPTMTANGFVLAYRLLHISGDSDEGEYPLPDPAHNPAQTIGSAITYARRYALCAATGIAPGGDDDDAQTAAKATSRRVPRETPALSDEAVNAALTELSTAQSLDDLQGAWERAAASGATRDPRVVQAKDDLKGLLSS